MPRTSAFLLVALASLSLSAAWPSHARLQDAAPTSPLFEQHRARFHGTWRLAITQERGRQIVDGAIEQTVDAMNFFLRPLARTQLRDNTPLNRRIDLRFLDGERIAVTFDGRLTYTTRVGRTERYTTPEGAAMRVTQRLHADGRLEQVFAADQGTRWNVYHPTGDGMRVEATTQGMMMPQPLYFTLDYRRAPAP
jgi:hypothetical protein